MKIYSYIPLFLLSILSQTCISQYGADGAVAALGHGALWAIELEDLETILDGQELLIMANVTLALEEAKLLDISKKRYESLSNVDDAVRNALVLGQIAEHGYRLIEIQTGIFELIADYPLVQASLTPAIIDLTTEQIFLTNDIANTLTEGDTNLANSSERLLYMKMLLKKIDAINDLALEIKKQAYALIRLREMDLLDVELEVPTIDYTPIIEAARERINNLVIPN